MSNYTKSVNFASKDALSSGDSGKIVKGTEIDTEFNNIATAVATKADSASQTLTSPTLAGPTISGNLTGTILATDGSAGSPIISFSSDTNTGIYRVAADTIGIASGGSEVQRIDSSGNIIIGGDTNTYLGHPAADSLAVTTGGSERDRITDTGLGIAVTPAEKLHVVGNFRIGTSVMASPSGTAPLFMARAWVNFNGTGTVALAANGNVGSITDNGTGDYTINFSTALPTANYAVAAMNHMVSGNAPVTVNRNSAVAYTTSAARIFTSQGSTKTDITPITLVFFN